MGFIVLLKISFVLSNIFEVSMNQNGIVHSVRVDDWTAEWAIIASNVMFVFQMLGEVLLNELQFW